MGTKMAAKKSIHSQKNPTDNVGEVGNFIMVKN